MTRQAQPNRSHAMRATIALTTSLTILSFAATPAYAGKRTPAPITFAGQGGRVTAPTPQVSANTAQAPKLSRRERRRAANRAQASAAPTVAATPAAPSRRIEFRYPDQPDTFYGANGARSATDAAPLSFSSSTSAISQAEAAKYTVGTPPAKVASASVARDPAITAGGFDARAAAARVACLLYTSPSPRDRTRSRMPSSA